MDNIDENRSSETQQTKSWNVIMTALEANWRTKISEAQAEYQAVREKIFGIIPASKNEKR